MKKKITKEISIEDLLNEIPDSVTYLMENGIKCLVCGEPVWGTLESESKRKGFSDVDIERFVKEINELKASAS